MGLQMRDCCQRFYHVFKSYLSFPLFLRFLTFFPNVFYIYDLNRAEYEFGA